MTKKRIQVYTDPETKRRIDVAAAKYDSSVTEYCFEAIQQRLAEDDLMESEQIEITINPTSNNSLIADLRALHEKIKTERGGELLDIDAIFTELHEARERELLGLC